jgi:hypothetical protein
VVFFLSIDAAVPVKKTQPSRDTMKYLFIILAIVLAVTGATLLSFWPNQPKEKTDVLVTINGHDISRSDIRTGDVPGSHHESHSDFLDSVITKELLINEAQKQNIDKEANFRKELKDYYEQSLIKILTERESASFHIQISDQEIENYLNCFGKTYTFLLLKSRQLPSLDDLKKKGTPHSGRFEDLSESLQLALANLKPGERAMEYETGNENYALLLQKIEGNTEKPAAIRTDQVRKILEDHKRRQQINNWILDLRKKASITIH